MSIEIDTHGARIAADDATVTCQQIHNIEIKTRLIDGVVRQYVEIETSGGEVEFHDLPDDVMQALASVTDNINK
jgi:hypothetical protein